jgi:hypothetical protein
MKPLIAFSGAVLISSLIGQSALAQGIVLSAGSTAMLAANNDYSYDALTVNWTVSDDLGLYTYDYTVSNPESDYGYTAESLALDFNAGLTGAVLTGPSGGLSSANNGIGGIDWTISVPPGATSGPLSFTSAEPPVYGDATRMGLMGFHGLPVRTAKRFRCRRQTLCRNR